MAVPKKKTSHQKQHSRRAHWKAELTTLTNCTNCGVTCRPHHVCTSCGYYSGRPARREERVQGT
ncbi:MAG: 50S ribosomal protein L32 [Candidatus Melainabacteria bacterium]|nr:50S ribosomal protein L32 [Candidatus Melainabacteria bacterium]